MKLSEEQRIAVLHVLNELITEMDENLSEMRKMADSPNFAQHFSPLPGAMTGEQRRCKLNGHAEAISDVRNFRSKFLRKGATV